jgi:CDP-glucose 4,6-dehydratase
MENLRKFYKNRNIFITGHTGFKGSWLVSVLLNFGARITGYSANDNKRKNYESFTDYRNVINIYDNILNYNKLKKSILKAKPEIIFHLAAQSIVADSFRYPYETFQTNLMGSLNIMNICKEYDFLKSLVLITSDKCYKNLEIKRGYVENDTLGGEDPYSASKAATEIVFYSYLKSFFNNRRNCGFSTVRAGNVIGGGDWSNNRIIPDCIRSIINKKKLILRNPNSTRPWQHVLEPISGYLLLAKKNYYKPKKFSGSWNFGPSTNETKKVINVVDLLLFYIDKKIKITISKNIFNETKLLKLNSSKAINQLKWKPKWNMENSITQTALWYKEFLNNSDIIKITQQQINDYFLKSND